MIFSVLLSDNNPKTLLSARLSTHKTIFIKLCLV
nr:MAG TPA: hypothetical protein [Caudoviricetes sp.]